MRNDMGLIRRRLSFVLAASLISSCSPGGSSISDSTDSSFTSTAAETPTTETSPTQIVDVRISEIHFHAPSNQESDEFVEIVSRGSGNIELQGWCIEGIAYCIEESTILSPGSFLVVRQPTYEGSLSNKGDELSIIDPLGQVLDTVVYTDREPWSELADGGGHSLQRFDFSVDGTNPAAWSSALPTPGSENVLADLTTGGEIVITEINYHPADDDPAARYVELENTTSTPIDLNGWCVEGIDWCWATSVVVAPHTAHVLSHPYGLRRISQSNDRLRIVSATGVVHDVVRFDDRHPWPAMADGHGQTLHRRDIVESGVDPGNWESRVGSPGVSEAGKGTGLLPTIETLDFALSPEPHLPLVVNGTVSTDVTSANLFLRIGFDEEITIPMSVSGSTMSGAIPGQVEGTLIRFRVEVSDGTTFGSFPRSGDGTRYTGTVVASQPDAASTLTRFQWFIQDDVYDEAKVENALHRDDGFGAVFAVNGEIVDNVTVRIKGNQARWNSKKKWKVMLPAGHEWDMGGLLTEPVDEFDLLPAATDKSYSREILTADMQMMSGGVSQQVFPVRLEKNNEFFGLYLYGESSDADWRDRIGLSADSLVYKAENYSILSVTSLGLGQKAFRHNYQRYTRTYADDNDDELRDLIRTLNLKSEQDLIRFAYEHIDVPQVIEALATMRVVQHPEWQHKNYFVIFDPEDERWRLLPIDFDLGFGRRYENPCHSKCDAVRASPWMEYPGGNKLARIFLHLDHFKTLVDRRTRTLADQFLGTGFIEFRLAELFESMEADAELDRRKWGQYGESQSLAFAQALILERYVIPKRQMYLESEKYLPPSQPQDIALVFAIIDQDDSGRVIRASVSNPGIEAFDISGRIIEDIGAKIPAGVVIPPFGSIEVVFAKAPIDIDADTPIVQLRLVVTATRWSADDT